MCLGKVFDHRYILMTNEAIFTFTIVYYIQDYVMRIFKSKFRALDNYIWQSFISEYFV